jgi:hypothetical protein
VFHNDKLAALEIEHNNKMLTVSAKYVALAGGGTIENVEEILNNHRQEREKHKIMLKKLEQHKQDVFQMKQSGLIFKSSLDDYEGAKRKMISPDAKVYKHPNPKQRKNIKAAAAQMRGNLPTPNHSDSRAPF